MIKYILIGIVLAYIVVSLILMVSMIGQLDYLLDRFDIAWDCASYDEIRDYPTKIPLYC